MSSLDATQFLAELDTLTQNLLEMSKGGIEQQAIATILKLADKIRQIGQACEHLHAQIHQTLSDQAMSDEQRSQFQKSQLQLLQIVTQCQGEAQSSGSLKKLWSDISQWRSGFLKILKQVEEIAAKQTIQGECQQFYQQIQNMQNLAFSLGLDNQRKLILLRHLIDMEKSLGAIDQSLQTERSSGYEERQKLDKIKQQIEEVRSTYRLEGV